MRLRAALADTHRELTDCRKKKLEAEERVLEMEESLALSQRGVRFLSRASKDSEALMSRKEVATRLGVGTETVKRTGSRDDLRPIYLNSRTVRYRRSDVEDYLRQGEV